MKTENRRELALKELTIARKHFEKIFEILDMEEETFELEEYYGTIDQHFDDLRYEIENMQLYEPEAEDPTDRETDEMILRKLEKKEK